MPENDKKWPQKFCLTNSPKPKRILLAVMYNREKYLASHIIVISASWLHNKAIIGSYK